MSNDDDEAERQNNLMATGAVVGALQFAGTIKFDPPEQKIDNRFTVRFPFLKSRYLITVERVPDEGDSFIEMLRNRAMCLALGATIPLEAPITLGPDVDTEETKS
jgi:hypothetical protein